MPIFSILKVNTLSDITDYIVEMSPTAGHQYLDDVVESLLLIPADLVEEAGR